MKKRNVWNIPETWEVSERVRQILEEAMECVPTDDSIRESFYNTEVEEFDSEEE